MNTIYERPLIVETAHMSTESETDLATLEKINQITVYQQVWKTLFCGENIFWTTNLNAFHLPGLPETSVNLLKQIRAVLMRLNLIALILTFQQVLPKVVFVLGGRYRYAVQFQDRLMQMDLRLPNTNLGYQYTSITGEIVLDRIQWSTDMFTENSSFILNALTEDLRLISQNVEFVCAYLEIRDGYLLKIAKYAQEVQMPWNVQTAIHRAVTHLCQAKQIYNVHHGKREETRSLLPKALKIALEVKSKSMQEQMV